MISEIDIADFDQLPPCKLYNTKPRTYIKLPWMLDGVDDVVFFDHLDGMYSYCLTMKNDVVHLSSSAEVVPLQKKTIDTK